VGKCPLAYLYLRTVPDPTSRCGLTFDTDSKLQFTDIIELCPWTARYAGSSDLCLSPSPVFGISTARQLHCSNRQGYDVFPGCGRSSDSRTRKSDSMDTDDDPSLSFELWWPRELDWADTADSSADLNLGSHPSSPTVIISAHLRTLNVSERDWPDRCFQSKIPKPDRSF
jgi:hypothetical protein